MKSFSAVVCGAILLGLTVPALAVDPSTVISGNFDPDTTPLSSMGQQSGVMLTGGFSISIPIGAYEDSSTVPGVPGSNPSFNRINTYKPFWTHATFFNPTETSELGRVVLPIQAQQAYGPERGLRLELWRVDGDRNDPENDWLLLGESEPVVDLPSGKQFVNFDFFNDGTPLSLESGEDYAFNLAPIAVGSSAASQAYFWLTNFGVPLEDNQILWNYNYNAPLNSPTKDATDYPFSSNSASSYGLLDRSTPGILIQDSSVLIPEPTTAALLGLAGLALVRRRRMS